MFPRLFRYQMKNSGLMRCLSIEIVGTPVLGCPKKHRISKADTPGGVSLRDILIGVPNLKQLDKWEFSTFLDRIAALAEIFCSFQTNLPFLSEKKCDMLCMGSFLLIPPVNINSDLSS